MKTKPGFFYGYIVVLASVCISYDIIVIATSKVAIPLAQFLKRVPGQPGLSPYGKNEVKAESLNLATRGLTLQQAILAACCHLLLFFVRPRHYNNI